MACCKSKQMGEWCKEERIVYIDKDGKEYCVFHAPSDEKGVSVVAFNKRVFELIRQCF